MPGLWEKEASPFDQWEEYKNKEIKYEIKTI